ncbi:TolC family protein [Sphingobacterium deserti]|uniref:Outer membrane efflux protein n=1 Tax=Sphingobacterium deserti TaxID=1229276 RepID=A0A0B8T3U8_9SPHI|nr:TolC family protein [Sphingobacterium deserti]KGE15916.1 outer membrane efflux protein [Sphingobacterium deserti]
MRFNKVALSFLLAMCIARASYAQSTEDNGKLNSNATLDELIDFALQNKIELKQADIDKEIGEREIASALSGWFPQINATGTLAHAIQIPTNVINGQVIQMGQKNTSSFGFRADQAILSPELFQASRAAKYVRQQNDQNIESTKITTVVDVSKAYYDILTSEESINIINENISRLQRQYTEANARYETGLVDKTDFKRALISLNNANAELKTAKEMRQYKYDYLKMLLGLNPRESMTLSFENQAMENNILLDTTEILSYANRVEYRQTETLKNLQKLNTQYQKWQFLPQLGAYGMYNANFFNNEFSRLYATNFPSSSIGLSLSVPIFTGTKRIQEIRKSELQEERIAWDLQNLENQISTEYSAAMANYRSNMNEWRNSKGNMELSEDVYNTIKLQYDAGIKTYLELMTAETDLKTSQLNYLNALYAVLSSKLDIQRALGTVDITE